MTIKTVIITVGFAFAGILGRCQTPDTDTPVKVGLVLSGGGAKGLAHIGVLKVIEETGVKIDYIAGTSMGAIVGALYASGYSAKALDSIFRVTNLAELVQDDIPRGAKTFYKKEDSERYVLSLPFTNFKVSFPQALSGGQNAYNALVRLLFHVKDIHNFNQLPIPFLCIATNVETGEEVVLEKGYLPEAIMASGALPSLFITPEINDTVLVDGGVVNNYPIDKIRTKGMDLSIGVDVQDELVTRDSLTSAMKLLVQINNYARVKAMKKKAAITDIYIRPNIEGFSVIDFNRGEAIVERGEAAAKAKIKALQQIAQRQNYPPLNKKIVQAQDSLTIHQLRVEGNNQYTQKYIEGKLRLKLNEKITFDKLQQGINNLYATGNFKAIRYELVSNTRGTDVILKLKENPTTMFLKMAAHYDDLYKSAALINLTKKNALLKDDVASFDFILGDHIRYAMQYYVDKGYYWSFGLNATCTSFDAAIDFGLIQSNFTIPDNLNIREINLDVTDITNQMYLQTVLREEFAFTLGLEHKFLRYSTRNLTQIDTENEALVYSEFSGRTLFENSSYFSTYGKIVLDTYDDKYFPTRGLFFDSDFHLYLFSSDFANNFSEFSIGKAKIGAAFSLLHNLSLNITTEGGFKLGKSQVTSFDFVLGGYGNDFVNNFIPFFGYDFLSLPGNSFVKALGKLDYKFASKHHALFAANFANVEDDLFRTGKWFSTPTFSGYGIGYGFESFLGPVQIYYSRSPEINNDHVFFSVGYWF